MKRLLSVFMLLTFLLTASGCGDKSAEPSVEASGQTDEMADLAGYEAVIAGISDDDEDPDEYVFSYAAKTVLGDALLRHITTVESELNCDISVIARSTETLKGDAASGVSPVQIIYKSNGVVSLAPNGGLQALSEYKDIINYEDDNYKWGSPYVRELWMYDGVQYGVYANSWPENRPSVACSVAVNEVLVNNYNLTDPRELIEQKNWTWDTLVDFIQQGTFEDNAKMYGMASAFARDMISAAFLSNGCEVIRLDDTEKGFSSDISSSSGLKAIQWALDLNKNYGKCFAGNTTNAGVAVGDYFYNSQVFLMLTGTNDFTSNIAYKVDKAGLVGFPCGPDGTYGSWAGFTYGCACFSIMSTADDGDICARIINSVCEPMADYPDYDSLKEYYLTNVFFDERDVEYYLAANDNARYTMYYGPYGGNAIWNGLAGTTKTAAEYVSSSLEQYMSVMEEYMYPNAVYIQSLSDK